MIKLYFPKSHYNKSQRRHLFPLLKPFIKGNDFTDDMRVNQYGVSEQDYNFVEHLIEADYVVLTMSWLYYKITNRIDKAMSLINEANALNKKVFVSIPSDFGVHIPKNLNIIVVREQGYKSLLEKNHKCLPVFIDDPLVKYYNTTSVFQRNYNFKPTVGFCGQADGSFKRRYEELTKIATRNLLFYLGLRFKTPHHLMATKSLRFKLLNDLKQSKKVIDNFIVRKQHRAGVEFLKTRSKHKSTLEFFDNINNSDYVLCVRGAGNFSVRLYETLAMGRIPIFVNTDSMLPHDNIINWREHMVWVDYKDRHQIAEIIADFHANLNEQKLNALFHKNRQLWENQLRLGSFFKTFLHNLN